jgi:uncharacterized protein (TIGR04255 family)
MRIESFDRVVYENNPLAEVVCQVRFQKTGDINEDEVEALKSSFANDGYTDFYQEVSISTPPLPIDVQGSIRIEIPQVRIHYFSSPDKTWKASVCSEFVALTCLKYSNWDDFSRRLLMLIERFNPMRKEILPKRLGLRYRDVIEREPLGLGHVPWHELVAPFLLGPLLPNALASGQTPSESEVVSTAAQSMLKLDSSMVLLQSALLTSINSERRAFLIDADFFLEDGLSPNLLANPTILKSKLDILHANAGALFRRGITERLHHALRPRT